MRMLFVIFFLRIVAVDLCARPVFPLVDKKDTAVTVVDSLLDFTYDVRNTTLFLNDKEVDFSIVFDPETNKMKPQYRQVHGAFTPYDAIKEYGEKYRKGVIVCREKSDSE